MAEESSTRLPLTAWLIGFAVMVVSRIVLRMIFPDAAWYVLSALALLAFAGALLVARALLSRRRQ